ncbi:hypothetical protein ACFFJ4_22505 [Xanthomonas dyei]|uniref:Uncharacterized protein n=1 Tax=Xanthomonas dyei TaxID=743699 RepID=A0A2S7BVI3_9XANT|nr:hypothetical protein [Xanthomonas dyei]PPU49303.1 hypothetical protein XdyCFBP7245_22450 [Xanthomonas dyei]
MRQLAAYSLSSSTKDPATARQRHTDAISIIERWLIKKGAEAPLQADGFFRSKTRKDDTGIYTISRHEHDGDELIDYTLIEKSFSGLDFSTTISALCSEDSSTIFCTLSVSSSDEAILDAYTDARCPAVIRDLLSTQEYWTYANVQISSAAKVVDSEAQVSDLVEHIKDEQSRKMPVVLVSEYDGEEAWPGFSEKIARDLVGAAEVVLITENGSRFLTAKVGKQHSCYLGAIRLYWPTTGTQEMPRSFVWTENSLLPEDESEDDIYAKRFQNKLRNLILSATAVAVTQPKRIKELHQLTATKELRDVRKSAEERIEQLELAIDDLTQKLEAAEHRNRVLSYQLQQAATITDIGQDDSNASNDEDNAPVKGEVRFYKKVANAASFDKMAQTNDCGHNAWQASNGAHKAKKGLTRFIGSNDWKSVQHCGTCTGGGVWKVEW